MTAVQMTAAQARKLGIDPAGEDVVAGTPTPSRRTRQRRTARGPYLTRCHDCGEVFTTQAAETRHLNATRHARYQLELP